MNCLARHFRKTPVILVVVIAGLAFDPSLSADSGDEKEASPKTGMSGKGKGRGKGRSRSESSTAEPDSEMETASGETASDGGIYGTITGISDDEVVFAASSSSGSGRGGKGKGRRGGGNEQAYAVAKNLVVTTGTIARRTSAFQPGMELGGGLENQLFDELEDGGGVRARIVIDEESNRITEINVIVADATMEEGIAVRPKRPPMKKEVGR